MKIIKTIQVKTLITSLIIFAAISFLGCAAQNQNTTASNQKTNSANSGKSNDVPKATPTIEIAEKEKTSELPDIERDSNKSPDAKPTDTKSKGNLADKITKVNFDKINIGMTHEEVTQIFGDNGMKTSEMHVNGHDLDMFMWSNDNFSKRISVTFEKNKVTEKTQGGL